MGSSVAVELNHLGENGENREDFFGRRLDFYENTHLELVPAREMMVKLGMKSAVIVSSPYYMRRLQLITGKVFGDDYRIGFEATPLERYDTLGCFRSWEALSRN